MKKCFLYAYDRQNLGDDLFVHMITKRYPDAKFYMWTAKKNRETFRSLSNLKVIDRDSRFVQLLRRIRGSLVPRYRWWLEKRCKAVVYIGGSLFMESSDWENLLLWWENKAETQPFYVLGANFGPYETEAFREKSAEIFGKMKDICFRDRYSYDLFPQVPSARQAPDILFNYPMPKVPVKEKQIFVSVINCTGCGRSQSVVQCDQNYVQSMAKLLKKQLEKGYSPVLCSFCTVEGDPEGIEKILQAMDDRDRQQIRVLAYDGTNADEVVHAIAQSECVIGTRFHATILAMVAGRPVLPLIYSDKTRHVLEDLNFSGTAVDIRTNEDFSGVKLPEKVLIEVASLGEQAQKHFEKLDQIYKK